MRAEQLIVRDYERRHREYIKLRQSIIEGGGSGWQTESYRGNQRAASRTTENRELRLERLENLRWAKEMHAVEHARDRIGAGMPEEMRKQLRDAIMLNCSNGRRYPFERLYTVGISRRTFYRIRRGFLDDVAAELSRTQPK